MRFVVFSHSLVSDWNHGNAHFLRGIATELLRSGHEVTIFEPREGWSRTNLIRQHGPEAVAAFERTYPELRSELYDRTDRSVKEMTHGADIVLVHEWNEPELVNALGALNARERCFKLFFHDTHHRTVTDPQGIGSLNLHGYNGVLAYGEVIRRRYLEKGWAERAWTWHEAADVRVFRPMPEVRKEVDLVWVGNWGDGERTVELREFLLEPVRRLQLRARVYGVQYPEAALRELEAAGIEYCGWLPNFRVPEAFAKARVTVHVPRRPYAEVLHGVPTIRPFEALACGVPLVSAPWRDDEGMFRIGEDLLMARNGWEMCQRLEAVLNSASLAGRLAESGLERIRARHTCAHRVEELLGIVQEVSRPALAGQAV